MSSPSAGPRFRCCSPPGIPDWMWCAADCCRREASFSRSLWSLKLWPERSASWWTPPVPIPEARRRSTGTRWQVRRRLAVMLLGGLTAGCQDSVKPSRPEGGLDQITVAYLCGNRFELRNPDSADKLVHYAVLGTAETGDFLLPAGRNTAPSITRLT